MADADQGRTERTSTTRSFESRSLASGEMSPARPLRTKTNRCRAGRGIRDAFDTGVRRRDRRRGAPPDGLLRLPTARQAGHLLLVQARGGWQRRQRVSLVVAGQAKCRTRDVSRHADPLRNTNHGVVRPPGFERRGRGMLLFDTGQSN